MKVSKRISGLLLALGVAAVPACNGDDDGSIEQANSNTSWLTRCVNDAECGSSFACLCGVCTRECPRDNCADLGGSCAAVGSASHALQCGGGDSVPVCLRACTAEHAECDADQACTAGGCVPRPERDPCAGAEAALVCSSFESLDAGATEFAPDGSAIAVSAEQSLYGAKALAVTVAGGSARSSLHYEFKPQSSGTLYLRAWLYLDVEDASNLHVHAFTVGSIDQPDWGTTLHVLDGKLGFSFPQAGDVLGQLSVPARHWFCVRTQIELDATNGAASVWVDDALSLATKGVDTLPADEAHNIAVGIDYTSELALRLYVDALRLGTTPVGCTE